MFVANFVLALIASFELVPGLIHVFAPDGGASSIADFTNYDIAKSEILWALGAMGGDQIFSSILYGSILFDIAHSRFLAGPILIWSLVKSLWGMIVPYLMNKDLQSVAPNAPGNFKALFKATLSAIGIIDEYLLQTPNYLSV